MLKDQGYYIGVIDGKAGKNTIREIKNWQYLNAFDESGNINQEQLNILRNQNYLGKTLSNEEMKVIEQRNKNVIEKNKKASAVKKNPIYKNQIMK